MQRRNFPRPTFIDSRIIIRNLQVIWLDYLQWPALVVTVMAAWMVSTAQPGEREMGFWLFLISNVLWAVWGMFAQAYALILLQFCLAIANVHGVLENRSIRERRPVVEKPGT